jgi:DNA-binding GntR family transcriptional regulator
MAKSLGLDSLSSQRTADAAVELLRKAIIEGVLEPGQRLKEEELAGEMGTSRTPIRRALAVLEAEGLIEAVPHHGARVRVLDPRELDEMYQIRALLESYAAGLACDNATPADIERLQESCERFSKLRIQRDGYKRVVEENLHFHGAILDLSGGRHLQQMVRSVAERPLMYQTVVWYSEAEEQRSQEMHLEITDAIASRDPDLAASKMREHLLEGRKVLLAHMGAGELKPVLAPEH